MRLLKYRTSGTANLARQTGDFVYFPTHPSFTDLTGATVYLLVKLEITGTLGYNSLLWRSFNDTDSFASREIHIENGKLISKIGHQFTYTRSEDLHSFPEGIWMQIAVRWDAGPCRIWKAPYPQPLREIVYADLTTGAGNFPGTSESIKPWIVGNVPFATLYSNCAIQSFRYYNVAFDNKEILDHQFEYQVARNQVINADFGVFVAGNVMEQVRNAGNASDGIVSGTLTVGGLHAGPQFDYRFLGTDQLADDSNIAVKVFHQRMHNRAL